MASAVAPMNGTAGQNLDRALIIAAGSGKRRGDPAFQAYTLPIVFWSMPVWNKWFPLGDMQHAACAATSKVAQAARPWPLVYGPTVASVASCAKLDWELRGAATIVFDEGKKFDLPPPIVIKREVCEEVKCWRLERVEATFPRMKIAGTPRGGGMVPVWRSLRTKERSNDWGPWERTAFCSTFSKGQWPQARLVVVGVAKTNRCNFYVARLSRKTVLDWPRIDDLKPPEVWDAAPVGAIAHRIGYARRRNPRGRRVHQHRCSKWQERRMWSAWQPSRRTSFPCCLP